MQLFYIETLDQNTLSEDESRHCIRSLRKKQGETILATDGAGHLATLRIEEPDPQCCRYTILTVEDVALPPYFIHIAIAPTKQAERIEWFVEKATEMGVQEISLFTSTHAERTTINLARLKRKIVSASKQAGRIHFPSIHGITDLKSILSGCSTTEKYIAHLDETNPTPLRAIPAQNNSYTVLIGPEGDFTDDEVVLALQYGFRKVSLGPYRLRTETAGLAACQILAGINYPAW
jgi:16S rRNA (uracil1498-N3)-methyltransferase